MLLEMVRFSFRSHTPVNPKGKNNWRGGELKERGREGRGGRGRGGEGEGRGGEVRGGEERGRKRRGRLRREGEKKRKGGDGREGE